MRVTIHLLGSPEPIEADVPGGDLIGALSERFARWETDAGPVMLNRDHVVRIDLPGDESSES